MVHRVKLGGRLGKGREALVDDDRAAEVDAHAWYVHKPKAGQPMIYPTTTLPPEPGRARGRRVDMHQFITGSRYVDHANGDGLDNTSANLRPATNGQQIANTGSRRGSSSRFKGVYRTHSGRWAAAITADRRRVHLGTFDDEAAAARVYDVAARLVWGEYARLNFPPATPPNGRGPLVLFTVDEAGGFLNWSEGGLYAGLGLATGLSRLRHARRDARDIRDRARPSGRAPRSLTIRSRAAGPPMVYHDMH